MKTLFLIPARAGSKRLPGKNHKVLGRLPLAAYSILFAKEVASPDDVICVSTDDLNVLDIATSLGVKPPFLRPQELATDTSGTYEVIMHALNHYDQLGINFDVVLLLQVTSPFREKIDFENIKKGINKDCDMVVSVCMSKYNPYINLFEEDANGFLVKSKLHEINTPLPPVYAYNGSLYLMKVSSLRKSSLHGFSNINKYIMPEERSIDIDTMADWLIAEQLLKVSE